MIDAAYAVRDTVNKNLRYILTGDAKGRYRRALLYLISVAGIVTSWYGVALGGLFLLALTDGVIEFTDE